MSRSNTIDAPARKRPDEINGSDSTPPSMFGRWKQWLFLPTGDLDGFRRATGVVVFFCTIAALTRFLRAQPYLVPSIRVGADFFALPEPTRIVIYLCAFVMLACSLALVAGLKHRAFVIAPLALFLYFGFTDYSVLRPHFIALAVTYLAALSFEAKGISATRRIAQVSIFCLYFFSALQKLFYVDWVSGRTLYAYDSTRVWNDAYRATIGQLHLTLPEWQIIAILTVALEFFLAFALFAPGLRTKAILAGLLFHIPLAILASSHLLIPSFSLAVFVGYLAFLPHSSKAAAPEPPHSNPAAAPEPQAQRRPRKLEVFLASAAVFAMLLAPLRTYGLKHFQELGMEDRAPWCFSMFLAQESANLEIEVEMNDGSRLEIEPVMRMRRATNESELYGIANYFMTKYNVKRVKVRMVSRLNQYRTITRVLAMTRGEKPILTYQADPVKPLF